MAVPAINGTVGNLNSPDNNGHTIRTFAHTVSAGLTDSLLLVLVATATSINNPAQQAKWNGTVMKHIAYGSGTGFPIAAFWLLNPADGTFDVEVDWSVVASRIGCVAMTFTGAAGVHFDSASWGFAFGKHVESTSDTFGIDSLSVDICFSDTQFAFSEGAGQTEVQQNTTGLGPNPANIYRYSTSYKASTAGTTTMSADFAADCDSTIGTIQVLSSTRNPIPQQIVI